MLGSDEWKHAAMEEGRDRPPPLSQCMNFHTFLQCQHKGQGSSPQLPDLLTKQLGQGPYPKRVFTPRRWGMSVIETGIFNRVRPAPAQGPTQVWSGISVIADTRAPFEFKHVTAGRNGGGPRSALGD